MSDHNVDDVDDVIIQRLLRLAQAGISRFYGEGMYCWPKATFQKIFDKVDIEDPRIQSALRTWDEAGIIRFVKRDDCYLEALQEFPDWSAG